MGTPDHNTGCLWRSPLSSHTATKGPDGPAIRSKATHRVSGTSRAKRAETPNATRPTAPQHHPHHQSGIHEGAGRVKRRCFAFFVVGGALEDPTAGSAARGSVVQVTAGGGPWLVGDTVVAGSSPDGGQGGSVPGHSSATHNVVGMERYGHSNDWAHSHTSTRTTGGVMPNSELAAVAVSEPHAASFKQRISPSRIP